MSSLFYKAKKVGFILSFPDNLLYLEVQKHEKENRPGSGPHHKRSRDYEEEEEKKEGPAPAQHKHEEEKPRNNLEGERRKGSKEEQSKEEWNKGQSQEETAASSGIDLGDTV